MSGIVSSNMEEEQGVMAKCISHLYNTVPPRSTGPILCTRPHIILYVTFHAPRPGRQLDHLLDCRLSLMTSAPKQAEQAAAASIQINSPITTCETSSDPPDVVLKPEEVRLRKLAKRRRKKRLPFFNTDAGRAIRLLLDPHYPIQQSSPLYCALCGQNPQGFRGHRSSFKCDVCDVHLCMRIYTGLEKSCWSLWHSCGQLEMRKTTAPVETVQNEAVRVGKVDQDRLRTFAKVRPKHRIKFFNSADGVALRFNSTPHEPIQQKCLQYCALCGQNRTGFRGHRSSFKCRLCSVHLCIRQYSGVDNSCWSAWHSCTKLEVRQTPPRCGTELLGTSPQSSPVSGQLEEPARKRRNVDKPD